MAFSKYERVDPALSEEGEHDNTPSFCKKAALLMKKVSICQIPQYFRSPSGPPFLGRRIDC